MEGPRDQMTKGPEEQGTSGPGDQRTKGPEDREIQIKHCTRAGRMNIDFLSFAFFLIEAINTYFLMPYFFNTPCRIYCIPGFLA